jgi:hypothetical protein
MNTMATSISVIPKREDVNFMLVVEVLNSGP